jgi:hypothetical protein
MYMNMILKPYQPLNIFENPRWSTVKLYGGLIGYVIEFLSWLLERSTIRGLENTQDSLSEEAYKGVRSRNPFCMKLVSVVIFIVYINVEICVCMLY